MEESKELYRLLADLLEYPRGDYASKARRCLGVTTDLKPEATQAMSAFVAFVETTPQPRLEESFTATFDLKPECCPYAGHHLLGDNSKRGMLLVKLQEAYQLQDFEWGQELPDHVAVMLRFMSILDDEAERREMLEVALVPAFEKMAAALKSKSSGYGLLVQAATLALGGNPFQQASGTDRERPGEIPEARRLLDRTSSEFLAGR